MLANPLTDHLRKIPPIVLAVVLQGVLAMETGLLDPHSCRSQAFVLFIQLHLYLLPVEGELVEAWLFTLLTRLPCPKLHYLYVADWFIGHRQTDMDFGFLRRSPVSFLPVHSFRIRQGLNFIGMHLPRRGHLLLPIVTVVDPRPCWWLVLTFLHILLFVELDGAIMLKLTFPRGAMWVCVCGIDVV